jgi:diguanylate cyclase (GGDEF)-like protein
MSKLAKLPNPTRSTGVIPEAPRVRPVAVPQLLTPPIEVESEPVFTAPPEPERQAQPLPETELAPEPTKRSERHFRIRLLGMFMLAGALILTAGIVGDRAIADFREQSTEVTHAVKVKEQLATLSAALKDAESDQRGFLLTQSRELRTDYLQTLSRIPREFDALALLVADNPQQTARVAELRSLSASGLRQSDLTLDAFDGGGLAAAQERARNGTGPAAMQAIDRLIETMRKAEDELLTQRTALTAGNSTRTRIFLPLAIMLCLSTLALAFWSMRREQLWRALAELELKQSHADLERSLGSVRTLADRLRQMSKLGELLQGCRSLTEAVMVARAAVPAILDGCAGAVYMLNSSQNTLESIGTWGEHRHAIDPIFAPEDCWAFRRNQVFPPADGAHGITCSHAHAENEGHSLCLPMTAQGTTLGVLYLDREGRFSNEQRRLARAVAEQLSLALANLQLQETLRTQSIRDPLTGLFNRRYLDASLLREFTRAERRGLSIAVLMIDVDHFKNFNDAHGHEAGDLVLAQIGQVLLQMSRPEDIACRYGGEELTLIMPELPPEVAIKRAEDIRQAVARMELQHRNGSLGPVTISIGVAVYPTHGRTPDLLRQAADKALYAAKHAGRDRVVVATA